MRIIKKFKGDQKRLNWFLKKAAQGKISASIPELTAWELRLLEFFTVCVNDNGLNVQSFEIIWNRLNLSNDSSYYESILILNRCYNYLKSEAK